MHIVEIKQCSDVLHVEELALAKKLLHYSFHFNLYPAIDAGHQPAESSSEGKELGVMMDTKLNMSLP